MAIGGFMALGAGLGLYQTYQNNKAQNQQRRNNIMGAVDSFKATNNAARYMQINNTLQARSVQRDVARAGAENIRDAKVSIKKAEGSLIAKDEGVTAGTSRAREMSAFYVAASKEVGKVQDSTMKKLIQVEDNLDNANKAIEDKVIASYRNMLSVAAGNQPQSMGLDTALMGMFQGATTGASLGSSINTLST